MNIRSKVVRPEYLLFLVWVVVQFVLFQKHGIKVVNDSHRYINYANNLIEHGFFIDAHNKWYMTYVLFLTAIFKTKLGLGSVVILQTLISGCAFFFLSKSVQKYYPDKKHLGAILLSLLIFWVKLSEWNFYIMTESLYISLICITGSMILLALKKELKWPWLLPMAPILFFTRPSSLAFFAALTLAVAILKMKKSPASWLLKSMMLFIPLLGLLAISEYMLQTFDMISVYNRGELVYAYGLYPSYPHQNLMVLDVPEGLYTPSGSSSKLWELLSYIGVNFFFFMKLALGKCFYFIGNIKPYFSWGHNLFIIAFLWPVYGFSIKGGLSTKSNMALFVCLYVLFNSAIVILSTEDWDGRFLLPVLPAVFILASIGLSSMLDQRKRMNTKTKDNTPRVRSNQ